MPKKQQRRKKRRDPIDYDIDFKVARKQQKEMEKRGSGNEHELKQGWNYFYICPSWTSKHKVPWKEVHVHGFIVCPKANGFTSKCRLCSEWAKARKKGDTKFSQQFKLKGNGLFNAIRKEHIKKGGPIRLLKLSPSVFEQVVDHVVNNRCNLSRPNAAILLGIKRKGKNLQTKYTNVSFSNPLNLSKWITEDVLANMIDLDTHDRAQPASDQTMRKAISNHYKKQSDDSFDDDGDDILEDSDEFDNEETDEDELFDEPDDGLEDSSEEFEDDDLFDDEDGSGDDSGDEDDFFDDDESDETSEDDLFDDEEPEVEEPPKRRRKKQQQDKRRKRRK